MSGKPSFGGARLFADEPWGKGLYQWMIAGFSIANSFLLIALGRRSPC